MKMQKTKLAAAAMVLGLTLSGGAATGALSVANPEQPEARGGASNYAAKVIRVSTDKDGAPRAGYMAGRYYFVGNLAE